MRLCSHAVQSHLENLQRWWLYHILGDIVPVIVLTVKKLFLILRWNLSWCNLYLFPLSSPYGSLWRDSLHPLGSHPFGTRILWWGPPWAFSSPGRKELTPSVFPHQSGCPSLWSSSWPSFWPFLVWPCLSWVVGTRTGHNIVFVRLLLKTWPGRIWSSSAVMKGLVAIICLVEVVL